MPEAKLFEETMKESQNFFTNRESGRNYTDSQIKECIDLLSNAGKYAPHRREFMIREALTTSDFPYLFGEVLDRQVLNAYKGVDPVWKKYTKMSTVRDFRPAHRYAITGGDQHLELVAEKGEYLASDRNEFRYLLQAYKYGRQFDISWESLINDDLGALKDTPTRFALAAVRTEHRILVSNYSHDSGGAATHVASGQLYSTAAGEVNETAALLTIANLENACEAMAAFLDANGEPIMNRARYLVVPPSLEMTGRQILTSANKMWVELGGAGGPLPYPTTNVISQYGLELIVDPYLPVMDPVAANGLTAWYLFANPVDIAALEFAYLAGHERPEICMKNSDKVNIAGGQISAMDGDFATDNVFYRVRDCFGVCSLDWRATFMGGHSA